MNHENYQIFFDRHIGMWTNDGNGVYRQLRPNQYKP